MKLKQIFVTAIAVSIMIVPCIFATDASSLPAKNDVQAAADGVLDHLYNDSFSKEMIPDGSTITLSEGLPCVFSTNFTTEMTFDSIKQAPEGYYFSFYVNGIPGGYAYSKIIDDSYKAAHVSYSETEYAVTLKSLEYDEVVLVNDWRDEYYLIRKNGEEYIIPGLMRNQPTIPMPMSTEYGLSELVNAIQYRDKFHPIDPTIVGGSDSDTAWQYIGVTETNQTKSIVALIACVVFIGVIPTVIILVQHKKKNISDEIL